MQFIYPEFLYAFFLLAIPIIIHLFNFKRFKTLYFPDVSFLKEIKQRSQATSRIRHILVLLSRLLLLSCLILAFAQPFWKDNGDVQLQGKVGVQIYLDNSFSMQSQAKQGILFDEAKQRVYTIINSYSLSDQFQIISNSFEADANHWLNQEAAIERIQTIEIDNGSKSLSEIMNRLDEVDQNGIDQLDIFLISDFQQSNFDLELIDSLPIGLNLVVLDGANNENISLQNLQFEKPFHLPEQIEQLEAQIIRHGPSDKLKIPVKLYIENQLKVPLTLEFARDDTINTKLSFQSGVNDFQKGQMTIKDYPITFDDTVYFNYELKSKIKILHLYQKEANRYVSALFSEDSLYEYSAITPNEINYTELNKTSFIIIDELSTLSSGTLSAFENFIKMGGDILFIPPNKAVDPALNEFFRKLNSSQYLDFQTEKAQVGEINNASFLFKDVFDGIPKNMDLPTVDSYWITSQSTNSLREDLLVFKNGLPLLKKHTIQKGNIYLFTSPLSNEQNTFCRHALFVPTLYNLALYSQERKPLYFYLDEFSIQLEDIEANESPIHLIGAGLDLIPQQEYNNGNLVIRLNNSLKKAGHYALQRNNELLGYLSLNYSRSESDFRLMTEEEIQEFALERNLKLNTYAEEAESLNQAIRNSHQGHPLWKYFIILALLFMGIEIALLRILK